MTNLPTCKICGSKKLTFFAHTASCLDCGVLLCYPYPAVREEKFLKNEQEKNPAGITLDWHLNKYSLHRYLGTDL